MKGRKAIPTKTHEARGTKPQKDRSREPKLNPGRPEPPAYIAMNTVAMHEWNLIVGQLEARRTLGKEHRITIANYCLCVARLSAAQQVIDEEGMTYETEHGPKRRPEVIIVEKCIEQLIRYSVEMCITQASQSKATAAPEDKPNDPKKRFFKTTG